jgi:hypothetical protein
LVKVGEMAMRISLLRGLFGLPVAVVLVVFPGLSRAQDSPYGTSDYGGGWAVPSFDTSQSIIRDVLNREMINRVVLEGAGESKASPRPSGAPAVSPVSLSFTPNLALRQSTTAKLAAGFGQSGVASPYRRFVASGEALSVMHRKMSALGLSPNNLGDAMAFFIASHWTLARGKSAFPTRAVMRAFKTQLSGVMSTQPGAIQMTNAGKQNQADSGLLLLALMTRGMEEARGEPSATARIGASATRTLIGIGFDPATFDLTTQGMVPVR